MLRRTTTGSCRPSPVGEGQATSGFAAAPSLRQVRKGPGGSCGKHCLAAGTSLNRPLPLQTSVVCTSEKPWPPLPCNLQLLPCQWDLVARRDECDGVCTGAAERQAASAWALPPL